MSGLNLVGKKYYDQYHYNYNLALERLFFPIDISGKVDLEKRSALLDWIYELKRRYKFSPHTFEMAINIVDRYLALDGGDGTEPGTDLCMIGLCALYISNIYNEKNAKSIDDFVAHSKGRKLKDIIKLSVKIGARINYRFKIPLYQDFFCIHHGYTSEDEYQLAHYLIYTSLYNPTIIRHPPSHLVSGACWLAHILLTKEEDDDLDFYICWHRASFGVIPNIRVVVDLFNSYNDGEHLLTISNDFGKVRKKLHGSGEKSARMSEECIMQQMDNMLKNVAFEERLELEGRRMLYNEEINNIVAEYSARTYPRTVNAHKKYLKKYALSDGTYGKVFKGYRVTNREEVAIKKFFDDDPDELSCSTLRELDSHLSFNHPNIVKVFDLYYQRKYYFLVMELCHRGDLFDYLRERKLRIYPEKWVPQLLSAINYLHKLNWIQRDLKTPNLLLDGDLNLKLTDFGLSRHDHFGKIKLEKGVDSDAVVVGDYTPDMMTLNYRAPEMLFGQSTYDMRVDCWSVGCIIGEIYLRSYLFHGDDELRVVKNIFKQLGFPQSEGGKDPKWTKKFSSWYIWKEHFQHYDQFTMNERFEKKEVDIPSAHWHVMLKLLELDPDKRWYCCQCLDYLNEA